MKYIFILFIATLLTSCTVSQDKIDTTSRSPITYENANNQKDVIKFFTFPQSITIGGVTLTGTALGVIGNLEKWNYGSLSSGAISITKIMDGKFRSLPIFQGGGEDTELLSLDDFFERDVKEILGMLDFLSQNGASDEKFMIFWSHIKPYMGEVWTDKLDSNSIEFGYLYPQSASAVCYFYDGKNYYRAEYQKNFDGDSLSKMSEDDIKNVVGLAKADILTLKGNFCKNILN